MPGLVERVGLRGVALVCALQLGACGIFSSPSVVDEYFVVRINGQTLPAPLVQTRAVVDGVESQRRIDLLWGTMTFYSDNRVEQRGEGRRVIDGIPGDSLLPARLDGKALRTDTEIVITFRNPLGFVDSLWFLVLEGGDVVVGAVDPGYLYEYRRN